MHGHADPPEGSVAHPISPSKVFGVSWADSLKSMNVGYAWDQPRDSLYELYSGNTQNDLENETRKKKDLKRPRELLNDKRVKGHSKAKN